MGNGIDSRSSFEGGYLYIKTDKQFYYPGDKVYGKVYIRTDRLLDATHLDLRVKGKEKASFYYSDGDDREKKKLSHMHMDCKLTAF